MELSTPCKFCKDISSVRDDEINSPLRFDRDFLHTRCETCPSSEADDELCATCRHLNIGHVLSCLEVDHFWFKVVLGSSNDISKVQDCALHRVLQSAILGQQIIVSEAPEYTLHFERLSRYWYLSLRNATKDYDDLNQPNISVFCPESSAEENQLDEIIARGSVQEIIDWDRVKRWIASCTYDSDDHKDCRFHSTAIPTVLPKHFRVIDVEERRLVHPGPDVRFVALSYVWGKHASASQLETTKDNFKSFQEMDSLKAEGMPRTIEDAIQACRKLGERYLWVDRLSIVQDDLEDKKEQISGMAAIYSKAVFTLVIACADNMDVQIPGVSLARRAPTRVCRIGIARILNRFPALYEQLNVSTWENRGWTLQERLLSERKLYITPSQSIWSCRKGIIYEDNTYNVDPESQLDQGNPSGIHWELLPSQNERNADDGEANILEAYFRHSWTYDSRDLSHGDDIYNAFSGILTALYPADDKSTGAIYGLPLRHIDAALLWYPWSSHMPHNRTSEKLYLPSWSWSSSKFRLGGYMEFSGTLVKRRLVSAQDPTIYMELEGRQTPLKYPGYGNQPPWIMSWRDYVDGLNKNYHEGALPGCLHITLAQSQGCLDLTTSSDGGKIIKETPLEDYFQTCAARWPTYASYWNEMFGPCTSNAADHAFSNDQQWLLQTQAQTAVLGISHHTEHKLYICESWIDSTVLHIFSPSGKTIGVAPWSPMLDAFIASNTANGSKKAGPNNRLPLPGLKAMALSLATMKDELLDCCVDEKYLPDDRSGEAEFYRYITYQDSSGAFWNPVPVVNVMFIGERDGRWYRMGIGRILLKRWVEMERKVETITLC